MEEFYKNLKAKKRLLVIGVILFVFFMGIGLLLYFDEANTEYEISVKGIYQADMALIEDESESMQIKQEIKQQTITVHTFNRSVVIDITKAPYNAVGDGKTLNTKAIQSAIDDCPKDGCVMIPSGTFMTGALRLHSNMELYLAKGAILQGTANPEDYLPRIWSRFEGTEMECYSSLLNLGTLDHTAGPNCENVILRGKGTITSGGKLLAERMREEELV